MAAAPEETSVSYEDLAEIERGFDEVETQIIRQQIALSAPLYERRAALVAQIPNFWPLVFEQAPLEIDQHIQLTDSALILSSLRSLSVTHFEPEVNPRSLLISFEFSENEHFEDKLLEKKFWWRTASDGMWSGLVSEPVGIKWKSPEKDLTGGFLDLVLAAEKSRLAAMATNSKATDKSKKPELTSDQKALQSKIQKEGINGLSFFAWFGFIGPRISAEESAAAVLAIENRKKASPDKLPVLEKSDEEDQSSAELDLEICPDGDEVAVAFAEDLWPGAIKYFTQAQEQGDISDVDFESDDENSEQGEDEHGEDEEEANRPNKKRRAI
ncbi:hypothetical protein K3495_g12393 [Podosphaera aphanis]|nr:hypothetical protein K3495_g12393 [Podosphaera aphanis]